MVNQPKELIDFMLESYRKTGNKTKLRQWQNYMHRHEDPIQARKMGEVTNRNFQKEITGKICLNCVTRQTNLRALCLLSAKKPAFCSDDLKNDHENIGHAIFKNQTKNYTGNGFFKRMICVDKVWYLK